MSVTDRIAQLRKLMEERNMDAYIIPSADNHQSEYVGEHFKARAFISGFTGSAGTVIVTKEDAGLWTDGRYFIQAEKQLEGSGIRLFRMAEPGVPTKEEFLASVLPEHGVLGFDGKVIGAAEGQNYENILKDKNVSVSYEEDLISYIWQDRPALSDAPAFLLDLQYAGESAASKLKRLREKMKESNATLHILSSLDDIAWLLNIRGGDVMYTPLVLSYAVITMDDVHLFINETKLNQEILDSWKELSVILHPYEEIYSFVKTLDTDSHVLLDPSRINYAIYKNLPEKMEKVEAPNPTTAFKAIKNETELKNVRISHIKDGVAFTKFMYWLKKNVGKMPITERSASDKLEEFRSQQEGFISPSFSPIVAYKEHAAMMHYSATPESDYELKPEHFLLADTGGNYYEGTTDLTRTVVLGPISDTLKKHFTAVARGMMNLARARFLYGCRGVNLDILAREPMWSLDIDYKCGTGHGVGYLLNIHEGPASFHWQLYPSRPLPAVLEEGMVITDEPGIYVEDSHGIRLENELVVRKGAKNEFGQFMGLENVTVVPIDLDAIIPEDLNKDERDYLNHYHKFVYETLSPYMTEEENEWLKEYTREI